MSIAEVVERIRQFPDAAVLCDDIEADHPYRQSLAQLIRRLSPAQLPPDYHFFLDHYDKLDIETKVGAPLLDIFGVGPSDWDATVVDNLPDAESSRIERLYIAMWMGRLRPADQTSDTLGVLAALGASSAAEGVRPPYRSVLFYLDLAGSIQESGILAQLDRDGQHVFPFQKVANSFAEWLELVMETQATFGYSLFEDDVDLTAIF